MIRAGGRVRQKLCIWFFVGIVGAVCSAAQRGAEGPSRGDQFVGTWTGTWEGAGSGGFELTLDKATEGTLGGRVSVTGDPTYKATLKTVSFDGAKMDAKYDFPPDDRAEVVLAATFDGKNAKGTWIVREKSSGNEVASGTWNVTRK
jgi:hypothetical protein